MKGNLKWKKFVTVALSLSLVLPFATELKVNAETVSYDSGSTIYETNLEAGESKTVRYTINVDKTISAEDAATLENSEWFVGVTSGNLTVVEDIAGSDMHLDYIEATGKVTGTIDIDVTIPASATEGTSTIVFYNDCGSHASEALTYSFDANASDYYQNVTLTYIEPNCWKGSNNLYYDSDEMNAVFGISNIQNAQVGDVINFTAPVKKYTTNADCRLELNISGCNLTETTTFYTTIETYYDETYKAYSRRRVWRLNSLNSSNVSLSDYGLSLCESIPTEIDDFTVYVNNTVTDVTKKAASITVTAPRDEQATRNVVANNESYDEGYDYLLASVNVNYSRKQAAANNSNASSDNGSTVSIPAIVAANVNGMQLDSWTAIDTAIGKVTAADITPVADADATMMKVDICGSNDKTVPQSAIASLSGNSHLKYFHIMIGESDAITFDSQSDISGYKETDFTHTDTVLENQRLIAFSSKQSIGTTVLLHTTVEIPGKNYNVYLLDASGNCTLYTSAMSTSDGKICFPISETGKYILAPIGEVTNINFIINR